MAATASADVSFISKVIYDNKFDPKDLVGDRGLLSAIGHDTKFTSAEGIRIPIPTATPQGASAQVAEAVAGVGSTKGKAFLVPQTEYHVFASIEAQVMENAKRGGNESHVIDQAKLQTDMAYETMGAELARQAYGSETGVRGRCSATTAPASSTITLESQADVVNFSVGMTIVAANSIGTILGGTPGYATIIGIDPDAATLTVDGTITTQITSITTGSYLFRRGDAQDSTTTFVSQGLADWVPATVTSTLFNTVDRTQHKSRLAGVRYDASNDAPDIAFIKARARASLEVGQGLFKQGDIFINPLNLAALEASKEGGKWITEDGPYGVGIEKFMLGGFKFVKDYNCPLNLSYMVGNGSFERVSCGDGPYWMTDASGADLHYVPNENIYKGMLYWLGNFAAKRPGNIVRITLPTSMGL